MCAESPRFSISDANEREQGESHLPYSVYARRGVPFIYTLAVVDMEFDFAAREHGVSYTERTSSAHHLSIIICCLIIPEIKSPGIRQREDDEDDE